MTHLCLTEERKKPKEERICEIERKKGEQSITYDVEEREREREREERER